ncbi:MerR family DNA-binding transcriptional regulator, partial [Nocardia carnea]|uniref:MerR family DNA-binding transcriptional regulator n=1 Tax=Nocardia carnea TaxID=37328 RepID=UPI003D770CB8
MSGGDVQTRNSAGLRTAEVARRTGYSVQQVRNLERDGALPPAARTANGYRVYGDIHIRSARANTAQAAGNRYGVVAEVFGFRHGTGVTRHQPGEHTQYDGDHDRYGHRDAGA